MAKVGGLKVGIYFNGLATQFLIMLNDTVQ